MKLSNLLKYLSEFLNLRDFPSANDVSQNGLQVESNIEVNRIATAVDACMASFEKAVELKSDLLLVHHGLFWGKSLTVTGMHGQRIVYLIQNKLSLYAMHLPLDIHSEIGNNVLLAKQLNLEIIRPFGNYNGVAVGLEAKPNEPIQLNDLAERVARCLSCTPQVLNFGDTKIQKIAIVTGSGASEITAAATKHMDVYITGEGGHSSYHQARDFGLNVIYAGHYKTETLGIRALGEHIQSKFNLPHNFIDVPTGF